MSKNYKSFPYGFFVYIFLVSVFPFHTHPLFLFCFPCSKLFWIKQFSFYSSGIFSFLSDSGVEGHDRRWWKNMDTSRKDQREGRRDKGQEIRVIRRREGSQRGRRIKTDREHDCQTEDGARSTSGGSRAHTDTALPGRKDCKEKEDREFFSQSPGQSLPTHHSYQ